MILFTSATCSTMPGRRGALSATGIAPPTTRTRRSGLPLAHLLQVVGEAARRVSDGFCRKHSDIPWKAIIGMRHKVVHDYMDVDVDIVWDTVTRELPPLIELLEAILPTSEPDQGEHP